MAIFSAVLEAMAILISCIGGLIGVLLLPLTSIGIGYSINVTTISAVYFCLQKPTKEKKYESSRL